MVQMEFKNEGMETLNLNIIVDGIAYDG